MALMQITVVPLGTETASLGEHVADIQRFLKAEGVVCRLHDMGTVIEGEVEELLRLAARLHELPFRRGVMRVLTQIVLDERRDKRVVLGDKVASVAARLGNELKTTGK